MDPRNKKRCAQFGTDQGRGAFGEGGNAAGRSDVENTISRLLDNGKSARNEIERLKQRLTAMDDIEDRLYSNLARLMDRYTKPVECDMLRMTCLESTVANIHQVDLPRISKLELSHAQQQQQLKLLSTSHDQSQEVELPRISKLELATAQMQQQIDTFASVKAVDEDSGVRSSVSCRLQEMEDRVAALKAASKEVHLTATAETESGIDELKAEVSLVKKLATDISADACEVAAGMKSVRDRMAALEESWVEWALQDSGPRLGAVEEKVDALLLDSNAKVSDLDSRFASAVAQFELSVGTNFANRTKEFETYLHSKMKDLVESNLEVNFATKMMESEASLRKKVKLLENNLKTNFTAKTAEIESAFCSRVEEFDDKMKELQAHFGSKLADVETGIASQLEDRFVSLETSVQAWWEACEHGKDNKSLDNQVRDMSSQMAELAVTINELKDNIPYVLLPKPEDQARVLSTLKSYEAVITRLSTRLSALDSMIVTLKTDCLTKEAEFLKKFSEFEISHNYMTAKFVDAQTDIFKLKM